MRFSFWNTCKLENTFWSWWRWKKTVIYMTFEFKGKRQNERYEFQTERHTWRWCLGLSDFETIEGLTVPGEERRSKVSTSRCRDVGLERWPVKHPEKLEAERPKKLCPREEDWSTERSLAMWKPLMIQEEYSSKVKWRKPVWRELREWRREIENLCNCISVSNYWGGCLIHEARFESSWDKLFNWFFFFKCKHHTVEWTSIW